MKRELIIIKLGGSIITYKNSLVPKARTYVIKRLAREIKQILERNKYQIIIVHGAGSFGHPLSKKYALQKGMHTDKEKLNFCVVDSLILKLNSIIIQSLIEQGIPAVGLPSHSFIQTNQGIMPNFNCDLIREYLNLNITPVFFGDAVLDKKWNCTALSGDTLIPYLATQFKAAKAIFLSDVDGVFDKNPKQYSNAHLIPKVTGNNLNAVLKGLTASGTADVTGQMKGKILSIKKKLAGISVFIANGLHDQVLQKIIQGESVGTEILL